MVAADIDVPVRPDDVQARILKLAGDELQEQQRRCVRPMQVIEHEQQRLLGCRVAQEGSDAVEQAEARLLTVDAWERGQIRDRLAQFGNQLSDLRRAWSDLV